MVWDLLGVRKKRRRRALWEEVAGELGGTFTLGSGLMRGSPWSKTNERIEAVVDGIAIKLDLYVVPAGNAQIPFTRIVATFRHGPGPKSKVSAQGMLARLGKALGTQDVELGDASFDRAFVVKTDMPAVTRRLWSQRAIATMVESFKKGIVRTDATNLSLEEPQWWSERSKLRAAVAVIVELASRDLYGLASLRAVRDGTVVEPNGDRPRLELALPLRVVIQAEHPGDTLVMVARVAEPVTVEPIVLDISDGVASDRERASVLPQGAQVALRAVGSGSLCAGADGVCFSWRDLELEPSRLRAGAELLGALASGSNAPAYR